jgi:hypothetical protein
MLVQTRRGIDVTRVLEKVIWLHSNDIWGKVPNIFSVINNADHMIAAREQCSGIKIKKGCLSLCLMWFSGITKD